MVKSMPCLPLKRMVVMPNSVLHIDLRDKGAVKAVEDSLSGKGELFIITEMNPDKGEYTKERYFEVGTVALVKQLIKMQNGVVRVVIEGHERAKLLSIGYLKGHFDALAERMEDSYGDLSPVMRDAMISYVLDLVADYNSLTKNASNVLANIKNENLFLGELLDRVCGEINIPYGQKMSVLSEQDVTLRYKRLTEILSKENAVLEIKNQLQEDVRQRVADNQRDYILREEIKLIREQLGDKDPDSEADELQKKLDELQAPEEVKEKIAKELSHLRANPSNSSESGVIRNYVETLLELPWQKSSVDNEDISRAEDILNEDHYGLEKVKEKIIEFLSVKKLSGNTNGDIICLVGPPGTGKTSIAKSIARALDREYVRISLGGVRDEAEIRGHRRTYIGAMPGRIIQGIRKAGVNNPLMLFDEVDKTSSDYKGDTASALLEVLDSEQNKNFQDHYVDLPFDLSEVLFICTANDASTIPKPLLDRMEIVELSGYTANEKFHIAKDYLIEKQKKLNGISPSKLSFTDEAIVEIIDGYTREAGVRSLERRIRQICRKSAELFCKGRKAPVKITAKNVSKYLGTPHHMVSPANSDPEIGIVRGLAWTSVGGDTLEIEVNTMSGKGELKLTGQLGDVMKESAQAGISYIRSVSDKYDIDEEYFSKNDIHIHIPEGAVPKDGPSAGITMATAMLSAITEKPVRADVAMTGEITLRGRVLPIGGLKEKLLAAKTAGMKTVCVPEKNRPDVSEISQEITEGLEIVYVSDMSKVLKTAFVNGGR